MLKIIKFRFSVKLNHNHNVRRPLTVTGLRNYLYKYILVKQYGGTLNLVLEDRKEKSTEAEPDILQCLEWLSIGPKSDAQTVKVVMQSQRMGQYKEITKQLDAKRKLYMCFCKEPTNCNCQALTKKYISAKMANKEKPTRILMHMDHKLQKIDDLVFGMLTPENQNMKNIQIVNKGRPAQIFSRISDGLITNITHYIQEYKNVNRVWYVQTIYQALGNQMPKVIHLPTIKYPKGSPKHISQLKQKQYTPKAVINAIALLGWAPFGAGFLSQIEDNDDSFSLADIIKYFKLDSVAKNDVQFSKRKLDELNGKDVQHFLTDEELEKHFKQHQKSKQFMKNVYQLIKKTKIHGLHQLSQFDFFLKQPDFSTVPSLRSRRKLYGKNNQSLSNNTRIINSLIEIFQQNSFNLTPQSILTAIGNKHPKQFRSAVNLVRYCISGNIKPKLKYSITEACCILGVDEVISRLKKGSDIHNT